MAQGFVRDLNLIESDTGALDRGILDNLGGANITTDLLLFDGNFKFISKIQSAHYTYDSDEYIITVTGEGKVAFLMAQRYHLEMLLQNSFMKFILQTELINLEFETHLDKL